MVTVASAAPRSALANDIQIIRLPHWRDSRILRACRFVAALVNCLTKCPGRVLGAVRIAGVGASFEIRRILRRLERVLPILYVTPDVMHFEWNSEAVRYMQFWPLWSCPIVVSCRGSQINVRPHLPNNQKFVTGLAESFSRAAAVHCVSDAIMREAMKLGLEASKAVVIRPAVDTGSPPPDRTKTNVDKTTVDPVEILSVGALTWRKGYEYALLAIHELQRRKLPVRYCIVGDGPDRERIVYTIRDLGLDEVVTLAGYVPPEDVRKYMERADIFLLSSLSEGIANAAIEAMASGLPVVSTECGGMGEVITDGTEGFLVPVRDPSAMASAMEEFIKDSTLRARMGFSARERVLREFRIEDQADQFLALYHCLAG